MKNLVWKDDHILENSTTIHLNRYDNLIHAWNDTVKHYEKNDAFSEMGYTLSFKKVDQLSDAFAAFIQHETTLSPGDRVAVQLPNILQFPVTIYGLLKAGLVIVNTNPLYTSREMLVQFDDAKIKALVFLDLFGDKVQTVHKEISIEYLIITSIADLLPYWKRIAVQSVIKYIKKSVPHFSLPHTLSFKDILKTGRALQYNPVPMHHKTVATLQYTGGTTGNPKGVVLTHRNLLANMLQTQHAIFTAKNDQDELVCHRGKEIAVTALPLYHAYSFLVHLFSFSFAGVHNVLVANPKDIPAFVSILKKTPCTFFVGLNTLFIALMKDPHFHKSIYNKLKLTISGGMPLTITVAEQWNKETGCTICEGYGLSECSPVVSINPYGKEAQIGTIGIPLPETQVKIIDPQTNKILPATNQGELCIKGPQVMMEYWNDPECTKQIIKDGWLHSGDMAFIQKDGFIRIIDRIKNVIIVSGFNVYPSEIENIVSYHPDISSCAAIGIPHKTKGEAIKLFVVSKKETLTEKEILVHCKKQLAGYKIPSIIEFRDTLPLTAVGKVCHKQLQNENTEEQ